MLHQNPEETNPGSPIDTKIMLYAIAMQLFDRGMSHPEIVEKLMPYETDTGVLNGMVDRAMNKSIDGLEKKARQLFVEGIGYQDIVSELQQDEPDAVIVLYICRHYDNVRLQSHSLLHSGKELLQYGIAASCVALVIFAGVIYLNGHMFSTIVSGLFLFVSLIAVIIGIRAKIVFRKIVKNMRS